MARLAKPLFAAMMRQCRPEHEGADYTIQASVQLLLGSLVGSASGALANLLGYSGLFLVAGVAGLLALVLVARYFSRTDSRSGVGPVQA